MTITMRAVRRLSALDWLAAALLGAGLALVALGVVPGPDAEATLGRIAPILVFLAAVVVLAELAARAEVFDASVAFAAAGVSAGGGAGGLTEVAFEVRVAFSGLAVWWVAPDRIVRGHSFAQDTRCCAVANRVMSIPLSARMT